MTEHHNIQHAAISQAINLVVESGLDGLPEAMTLLFDEAMRIERTRHIGADPHQRTETRDGHANGFKPKTIRTRFGESNVQIPQVRGSSEPFYPSALERGQRSEVALKTAIAEMYLQGVSTRRVTAIMEKLCGFEVTSTEVSRANAMLDDMLETWRSRPIDTEIAFLILDATYAKVRVNHRVRSCAVLVAIGVEKETGRRLILGCSVSLSEAEIHWRTFVSSLRDRGMNFPRMVVTDAHEGLKAALATVLTGVPWQRCQFHLQQNASAYIPRKEMKQAVHDQIRKVFNASERVEAERLLAELVESHRKDAPKLAAWMEENLPEGLTVFDLPEGLRRRLRTSNSAENLNKQIKRRVNVASLFPNEDSLLRLVSAILMEISEEWETGRAYLKQELL